MTPTREQVIQMAAEAGFVGYGEDTGEYSIPAPAFIARLGRVIEAATAAGRAQGLREAREVCDEVGNGYQIAGMSVAMECAAAIKQLEGK